MAGAGVGQADLNQVIAAAEATFGKTWVGRTIENKRQLWDALKVLKAWAAVPDEAGKSRYGGRLELARFVLAVNKEDFDSAIEYKEKHTRLNPKQKLIICIPEGLKTWVTTEEEDADWQEVPADYAVEE